MEPSNEDLLSNMPKDIIFEILARIPTKDAVRTSILSKSWRHNWTLIPFLDFHHSTIDNIILESLISKCPFLQSITLELFEGLNIPKICCLKLTNFNLYDRSHSFEKPILTIVLNRFTHHLSFLELNQLQTSKTCPLLQLMSAIPNVKKLTANHTFLAILDENDWLIPDEFSDKFHELHTICLDLDLGSVYDILVALCLFNSSPNLQTFEICCCQNEDANFDIDRFWDNAVAAGCNLNHLRVIKLDGMQGWEAEFRFIQFILSIAPVLENMLIITRDLGYHQYLPRLELLKFRCASRKAQVDFQHLAPDPDTDPSD